MTKEELKQEAEKYVKRNYCGVCVMADDCESGCIDCFTVQAYIASAEPREKEIKSLGERCLQLQKDKGNLTDKIRELERRIASIRGSHSVDVKKLNARIEQVERLKKENAELKDELKKWKDGIALKDEEIGCIETDFNTFKSEAKEIIKELLSSCFGYNSKTVNYEVKAKAEQFLKEIEE